MPFDDTDQDEFIAQDAYSYYSHISKPSFSPFKEMTADPVNFVLNPFIREVLLGNLSQQDSKLVSKYYYLINMNRSEVELDLSVSADFFARELLSIVFKASGTEQAFLKAMLTHYSITEKKLQEKTTQELRRLKDENENKWSPFGKDKS